MKRETVVVIGLGYVGLSLSKELSLADFEVIGIDSNPEHIENIIKLEVSEDIIDQRSLGRMFEMGFIATTILEEIRRADYIFICVPTPLDEQHDPDVSAIREASYSVVEYIKLGATVILESTSYPGTTEDIVVKILESKGLRSESDFFVVFSSERVDPGNNLYNIKNTPKIVAARSSTGMKRALSVYGKIVNEIVQTYNVKEAEMSKLIENSYRLINIAFINELARLSTELQIDLQEVLRLSASKPFGFQVFWPSPGVGGHCIPVDPVYLDRFIRRLKPNGQSRVLEAAIKANLKSTLILVEKIISKAFNTESGAQSRRIVLLGLTYKANSTDLRESAGVKIVLELIQRGFDVKYFDPLVPAGYLSEYRIDSAQALELIVPSETIFVILQRHKCIDFSYIINHAENILDSTHHFSGENIERI